MGEADALKGPHEIGKYGEREEKKNHLGLKISLGVGIPTAIIGGFFGYKALTNNNQVSTAEVQRALAPQDKKVEVVKKNYGQERMNDLQNQLYLDKNLTRSEARKAILEYQEGTGDRTPPFEVIASKRLSKKQMRKIDSDVDRALPGYEKAWFVQIEMENGGHFGYFLIKDKDFGIVCYTKLTHGDPMYGIVVQDQKIYRKP